MILESIITCLHCGMAKSETMPTDACRFLLRVRRLRREAAAKAGRLLRFLFLRLSSVPAYAGVSFQ